MIGALHKIWPWQEFFELNIGDKVMKFFRPLSPFNYPEDPKILSAIILFIIGSSIVWILDKQKEKKLGSPCALRMRLCVMMIVVSP